MGELQEEPMIFAHYSCSAMNLFGYDDDGMSAYQFRDGTLPLIPLDLAYRGARVKRFGEDMRRRKLILKEIQHMLEEPTHVADPEILQVSFLPGPVDTNRVITVEDLRTVARAIKQHWGPTRRAAGGTRRYEIVNIAWLLPPELQHAEAGGGEAFITEALQAVAEGLIASRNFGIVEEGSFAIDGGASDVFAVRLANDLDEDLEDTEVLKVGNIRSSHPRNIIGEILLPKGSTQLLPPVPLMRNGQCSFLYIEGFEGPIVGKLPPEVLKPIVQAVEPYACEPVRNNIAYIDGRRAGILRAHLGSLVLASQGIKQKLSSVIEPPPLKKPSDSQLKARGEVFRKGAHPTRR